MTYGPLPLSRADREMFLRLTRPERPQAAGTADHELHLRRVLHGYTGATLKEKRAAYEALQKMESAQ